MSNLAPEINARLGAAAIGPYALLRDDRQMILVQREDMLSALTAIRELDLLATQLGALAKDKDNDRIFFRDQADSLRQELAAFRNGIATAIQTLEATACGMR